MSYLRFEIGDSAATGEAGEIWRDAETVRRDTGSLKFGPKTGLPLTPARCGTYGAEGMGGEVVRSSAREGDETFCPLGGASGLR
jgi:hypothetical protein